MRPVHRTGLNSGQQDADGTVGVALPGTCGELVQGTLDGTPCLVSCPIDLYGIAEITLQGNTSWDVPADAPKTAAALRAGLEYLGCWERGCSACPDLGGKLTLMSSLPRGRGYASSTADVGAALYALGEVFGHPLTGSEAAHLAVGVEPSDSTIFEGLALFDHRGGSFHQLLGPAPALTVIVIDPGGEIDTLGFNRDDHRQMLRRLAVPHREAFETLADGLNRRDWSAVGYAATLSARCHQAILPNPLWDHVLSLSEQVSALGVCRAHSGTILGVLLHPDRTDIEEVARFLSGSLVEMASCRLADDIAVYVHRLVNGGPRDPSAVKNRLTEEPDECRKARNHSFCLADRPALR